MASDSTALSPAEQQTLEELEKLDQHFGDEAYSIAQQVLAELGYEVSLAELKNPDAQGVGTYPWR